MNKEVILKVFSDEDKNKAINLYEKMMLSYNRDIPMFGSDFYPPNIWKFKDKRLKSRKFWSF